MSLAVPDSSSKAVVVSVVSHGHGAMVATLLADLALHCAAQVQRVVLTLNTPEPAPQPPPQGWPFALEVRCNPYPQGFGQNHNAALADVQQGFVCVLNPDIRLRGNPFPALLAAAGQAGVGCAYPVQVDEQGQQQDSERALPTPQALWRRRVQGQAEQRLDWVNAAFWVLPAAVWRQLGGFDMRYFMYCEDVDFCLRLRLAQWQLRRVPEQVLHVGQRQSRRQWRHLLWHVRSLLRLWVSAPYRAAGALPPAQVTA